MKTQSLLVGSLVFLSASWLARQTNPKISAEGGGVDDRGSARVLYWNETANASAGLFAINYGRPVWKKDYEDAAKFDVMTKGKVWRLGSNFWTELDTELPLTISGRNVPVGSYYLGLRRSADGSQWSLAFIDPAAARKARLDAFEIQKAPVAFEAPMTTEKADAMAEKLTMTLSYTKENQTDVTLKVAWGNLALSAPIKVTLPQQSAAPTGRAAKK